jgi:hypothetical protein
MPGFIPELRQKQTAVRTLGIVIKASRKKRRLLSEAPPSASPASITTLDVVPSRHQFLVNVSR